MGESLNLLEGLELDLDLNLDPHAGSGAGPSANAPGGPSLGAPEGHFFGPYQLIQKVGEGGVAKVWRARHIHPGYADKTFAIKILHEELSRDPKVVELFRHEAYVLSLLKHPNVVETFEAGTQDDKLFIAMEYIDGRDLDNLVIRCQRMKVPLPIPVALHMVAQTLEGLDYAHRLKDADDRHLSLVHRDINPANVFLSFDGRVKLGDFGVASIAAAQGGKERELAGKAGYFAPEQLEGAPVDHRADLFAVTVMLFEMLCGVRLFQADSVEELLRLNRKAKIPRPSKLNASISKELEAVMLMGLQRRPDERFATGSEMLAALRPMLPNPKAMALAVAALMRKGFLNEHIQELQLMEGLAGGHQTRGSGQLILVLTPDPRAQAAFRELLLSRGYRVEVYGNWEGFSEALSNQESSGLLVDVSSPLFTSSQFLGALEQSRRQLPVIGFAESMELATINTASEIGAVDLVFKPFNIERILTAVRSAVLGVTRIAAVGRAAPTELPRTKPKVLILSKDPELIARLTQGLMKRDYEVEVSPTPEEALERTWHASHHAVIYDAEPASPADRYFAAQFRSQPGMGLVPILYLATPENQAIFAGVDAERCAVRPRLDPAAVLVQTLNRLRGDTRAGRTFLRYPASFPAEMRYGGRVFSGTVTDVSRGGVMIACAAQMPPVGTTVGLSLRFPDTVGAAEVSGRVVRVDLPQPGSSESQVGVEFERWASGAENKLVAHLATLDTNHQRTRQTMIMPMPAK